MPSAPSTVNDREELDHDLGSNRNEQEHQRPWTDDRLASNGKPVRENFKAWFDGSKVVTETGEPKVAYHGTQKTFDEFRPSPRGTFGTGIYFTDARSSAEDYDATRVVEVFVNLKNPWMVCAEHDSESSVAENFDCPLIDDVLLLPNGRKLLEIAKITEWGHFGKGLQNELIRLGHDGIVATYADGCQEIVAFRPDQVKCAKTNNGLYSAATSDMTDRVVRAERALEHIASMKAKKATPHA